MEYNSTQKKYLLAIIMLCSFSLSVLWFNFLKTRVFNNKIAETAEESYTAHVAFVDNENVLGFGEGTVIEDVAIFDGVKAGNDYTVTATLIDKETGKPVIENGKVVEVKSGNNIHTSAEAKTENKTIQRLVLIFKILAIFVVCFIGIAHFWNMSVGER